ncbi:MAG: DUF349 domain-containing protein, partial [Bacteroidetes bacterium]|nr:DUF349 domain-containing protein [Bacteroidota bacterium]
MLLENETPETSDLENNESVNQETEVQRNEENPTPEEEKSVEKDNPEAKVEVSESEEETQKEEPDDDSFAEDSSEDDEFDEYPEDIDHGDESGEESPVEGKIVFDENAELIDDSFPPMQEGLLEKVNELVKDRATAASQILEASVYDLIYLLDHYHKSDIISANIPKVGLVKRTFDAISDPRSLDHILIARFEAALGRFNKKRVDFQKKQEAQKVENSAKKEALLVELKKLVDQEDPLLFNEVRAIQDQWRDIGHVLKDDIERLYKEYRSLLDKFYKLREMHFELLDYDRRINLQEKERLIKEAEFLIPPEEDRDDIDVWRDKMDMLNEMQQKWKSIGHVPREDMERINNEYRAVIDRFFEVRQGFMEIQDQLRLENAEKKEEILT